MEGRLQKDGNSWSLRVLATNTKSGEVRWSTSVAVATENVDQMMQRSRLAGGLGHNLAVYLNALYYPGEQPSASDAQAHAKIVVDQATAYIDQTSRALAASQSMLEEALAKDPNNVHSRRRSPPICCAASRPVWYTGADAAAAEAKARSLLERALAAQPQYLPVLETYCRFMTATNHFDDALVACANALTLIRGTDWFVSISAWRRTSWAALPTRSRRSTMPIATIRRECRAGRGCSARG